MAGVKGRSGTNKGKDKPFTEALRMEIAAAGADHKRLRRIAAKALDLAEAGESWAVQFVADRLEGRPAQSMDMTVRQASAKELTDDELADIALGRSEGVADEALDPAQLN